MAMDIRKIKKLIEMLEESSLSEIEIREGEEAIRISRGTSGGTQVVHMAPAPMHAINDPHPAAPGPSWRWPSTGNTGHSAEPAAL